MAAESRLEKGTKKGPKTTAEGHTHTRADRQTQRLKQTEIYIPLRFVFNYTTQHSAQIGGISFN